jgi:hypothetical protein
MFRYALFVVAICTYKVFSLLIMSYHSEAIGIILLAGRFIRKPTIGVNSEVGLSVEAKPGSTLACCLIVDSSTFAPPAPQEAESTLN